MVTVSEEGAVAVVTLDDGKANVFAEAEFEALIQALEQVERSGVAALVLRGRPGYFSAGLNLNILPTLTAAKMETVLQRFGQAVLRLFLFPKPVVAEVSGHAIGAGAMLAFAADVRLCAQGDFKFGLNEVPNGLPVPAYGVEVARSVLSVESQLELIVHGRMVSPELALALGIAEAVYVPGQLSAAAAERARGLAELPSSPYALTKRNLREAGAKAAEAKLAAEAKGFASMFVSR